MRDTLQYAGHIVTCRRPTSGSGSGRVTVVCISKCEVVAALCGTDNGSYNFHCAVLAALCGAGVCLCLFLLLNVVYLQIYVKQGLVVGMTKQMSNGKVVDIVNC